MTMFILDNDIMACARTHGLETPYGPTRFTEFAQAMPDAHKVPGDVVTAYRRLYLAEKAPFARWTRHPAPDWWLPHAA